MELEGSCVFPEEDWRSLTFGFKLSGRTGWGAKSPCCTNNRNTVLINEAEILYFQKYLYRNKPLPRMKIDSSCCTFSEPPGPKMKCTLAVTVSIWSQFPGTSRQECCCLSTINNNTVKMKGTHSDRCNVRVLFVCVCVCRFIWHISMSMVSTYMQKNGGHCGTS